MKFSNRFKFICSVFLSLFLTNLPSLALANSPLISTAEVVQHLGRSQAEQELRDHLNGRDVKEILVANGVSEEEVNTRLASLSEQEMKDFSGQISEARAGGDILVTVLLVVLIIFLVKRI